MTDELAQQAEKAMVRGRDAVIEVEWRCGTTHNHEPYRCPEVTVLTRLTDLAEARGAWMKAAMVIALLDRYFGPDPEMSSARYMIEGGLRTDAKSDLIAAEARLRECIAAMTSGGRTRTSPVT